MDKTLFTSPAWLSRTEAIFGTSALQILSSSAVLVFGCGGVGGYIFEALVRSGIGRIAIVDHDTIAESNINRQIIADTTVIGCQKAIIAAERAKKINPSIDVLPIVSFADKSNITEIFDRSQPDYVCDAIDTVTSKLLIIEEAKKRNIPIISCMGTGNKIDPSRFKITDISKTSVCPLARVIRRELSHRNIKNVDVLFSDEEPIKNNLSVPASTSFVPAAAGLIIAGHVIRKLTTHDKI